MNDSPSVDRPQRADYVLAAIPLLLLVGLAGGLLTGVSLALASAASLVAAVLVVGSALFSNALRPD